MIRDGVRVWVRYISGRRRRFWAEPDTCLDVAATFAKNPLVASIVVKPPKGLGWRWEAV